MIIYSPDRLSPGIFNRHFSSLGLFLILFAWMIPSHAAETISWLEPNLAPNPDFEDLGTNSQPTGWTLSAPNPDTVGMALDNRIVLSGQKSLRIESSGLTSAYLTVASSSIPVEKGGIYMFAAAFRQEGFNITGQRDQYAGVSSYPRLQWLTPDGREAGNSTIISRFPYGPSAWDLLDALEPAPTNAASVRIEFVMSNDSLKHAGKAIPATLWVDAIQLRRYRPPPTPDWARGETARSVDGSFVNSPLQSFFVGIDDNCSHMRGGQWSRIVVDPQAERGVALQAVPGFGQGIMSHSPYFPAISPGLYRIRARVKLDANSTNAIVGHVDIDTASSGCRLMLPFARRPEIKPNSYLEFEGDFILRDSGWWDFRVFTHGNESWSIDWLKLFPLDELQDQQLLSIYPGSEGQIAPDLKPAPFVPVTGGPRKERMKCLVVAGLGCDTFRVMDAFKMLHRDAEINVIWIKMERGVMNYQGLQENPGNLFQYSIICLCNANGRGLSLKYKNAIREFVKRGGALLMMGGHQSFERGGWRGSLIEEILPVECSSPTLNGILVSRSGLALTVDASVPWRHTVTTECRPLVYYLHPATVKPSANVQVRAGDKPFLVTGSYGEGRVICVLGIPYGIPGARETPFWMWDDWIYLLRETCWWALKNPDLD